MRLDGTWPIPSVSRLDLSALPIDVSDFQAIMCGALARDAAEVSTAGRAFSEGVSNVKVHILLCRISSLLLSSKTTPGGDDDAVSLADFT